METKERALLILTLRVLLVCLTTGYSSPINMANAFRFTATTSLSTTIRHAILPKRAYGKYFDDRFVQKRVRHISSSPSLQSSFLKNGNIGDSGEHMRPSIAIVGSGAVGGYYGARLWESGKYDVKFQMRGENYEVSTRDGFRVDSIDGDVFIPPTQLNAFTNPEDVGPVDWVIVSIKSSSLSDIPDLIYPLIDSNRTRIIAIMNGLIEEDLIRLFKDCVGQEFCAALYGGMALVCSNRKGPGHIKHSFAGLLSGGIATSRENLTDHDNQQAFRDLWAPTSIDIAYEQSLLGGRWRKCLWNLPFNGISVAMNGITVDKIVNDPGLRRLACNIMDETVAAANADLAAHGLGKEFYLNDEDKKKMMDLSDNMGAYRTSTMIDFVEGRPLEVHYLFTKPVERARSLGVHVPYLETLVTQIEALERLR
jgi:2-dehydropantoate 2-reductase